MLAQRMCESKALRCASSMAGLLNKMLACFARFIKERQRAEVADWPSHGEAMQGIAGIMRNFVSLNSRSAPAILENSRRAAVYHASMASSTDAAVSGDGAKDVLSQILLAAAVMES